MATARGNYSKDNTSVANIQTWIRAIHNALAAFGWIQTNDTGQVQIDTLTCTITNTQLASNIAIYAYTGATEALRVGMSMAVTGITANAAVFNITGPIIALVAGTFSLAKTNANIASAADSGTGTVATTITTAAFGFTEIWKMNDTLQATTPVFIQMGYRGLNIGNQGPGFNVVLGVGSNGASSIISGQTLGAPALLATSTGATAYDCLFSGDSSSFRVLMWRDSAWPCFLNIERTKDISGADTAAGAFAVSMAGVSSAAGSAVCNYSSMNSAGGHAIDSLCPCIQMAATSTLRSGGVSVFPLMSPFGGIQNPITGVMSAKAADFTELDQFTVSLYDGSPHNYIVSKLTNTGQVQQKFGYSNTNGIVMRYD